MRNKQTVHMYGNLVHMPVKLLHNLYQGRHQKLHFNNRLLLSSTISLHNLNLHHLSIKSQHQMPLFWGQCFKRVPHCGSFRKTLPGRLLLP